MKTVGIIVEYNPLHTGHVYLLDAVKRHYGPDTAVICAMSGDFVQRGDFALLRRHARAEAAVRSGADLVLELPVPYAVSSAENFARGGVETLLSTGILDVLAFGSECGDPSGLSAAAKALDTPDFSAHLKAELAAGDSFAAARQRALGRLLSPEAAALLAAPNNTLGIEYCRALEHFGADTEIFTVPRVGAAHDALPLADGPSSASAIRTLLSENRRAEALAQMAPAMRAVYEAEEAAGRAPVFASACQRSMLARLRSMTAADFDALDTGHEGVGRRLYNASRTQPSLDAILEEAKTKRYAYARLRRMVLWAYLGLSPHHVPDHVPYLRVLAANERGRTLLRQIRGCAHVPVLTKPADVRRLSVPAQHLFAAEARAADLYTLAYPDLHSAEGGALWRMGPVQL